MVMTEYDMTRDLPQNHDHSYSELDSDPLRPGQSKQYLPCEDNKVSLVHSTHNCQQRWIVNLQRQNYFVMLVQHIRIVMMNKVNGILDKVNTR